MTKEKKSLVEMFRAFLSSDETKLAEETKTEAKEETTKVELESVLEDGTYELADGRSIVIEGGNVTEIMDAPAAEEEEAPAEEDLKKDEKAEEAKLSDHEIQLAKQEEITKTLEAKIVELEKATPLSNAPQKKAPKQLINLNSNMTYNERLMAGFHNNSK